jgi:hypothetical protein
VCQRWRSIVFQSPQRLNLRLRCTLKTRARDTLDIWPSLPIIVCNPHDDGPSSLDDIIAALEHNDRVCQIDLGVSKDTSLGDLTNSALEYVTNSAAMQKPFLELTDLRLCTFTDDGPEPILPDSFLGGTAPRLRSLRLWDVSFPGLPKLLLSATHLAHLDVDIPRSGYIPPEVMATSLSALTNLESLWLQFRCPRSRPALESRRPPPLTRSILPSLAKIKFHGASENLEEILARIDAPQLNELRVTFFNQLLFDTPQLFQFISRRPTLRAPEKGYIAFRSSSISVYFASRTCDYDMLSVQIRCRGSDWQLLSVEQVCTSSLPPVSALEDLYIFEPRRHPLRWQGDVENTLWLELLHPFAAVKNLYLCEKFVQRIAPALQELVGERTREVLPTLGNIFLEGFQPSGPLHKGIEKFVTARWLTSHPVAVSCWDRDSEQLEDKHWEIWYS